MEHSENCLRERQGLREKAQLWIASRYGRDWTGRWLKNFLKTWPKEKLRDYLLKFDYDNFEEDCDVPELARYMRVGWRYHSIGKPSGENCYDLIRQKVGVAGKEELIKFFVKLVKYGKDTGSEFFDIEFYAELKKAGFCAYEENLDYSCTCMLLV